jgi:hypothetical protein
VVIGAEASRSLLPSSGILSVCNVARLQLDEVTDNYSTLDERRRDLFFQKARGGSTVSGPINAMGPTVRLLPLSSLHLLPPSVHPSNLSLSKFLY